MIFLGVVRADKIAVAPLFESPFCYRSKSTENSSVLICERSFPFSCYLSLLRYLFPFVSSFPFRATFPFSRCPSLLALPFLLALSFRFRAVFSCSRYIFPLAPSSSFALRGSRAAVLPVTEEAFREFPLPPSRCLTSMKSCSGLLRFEKKTRELSFPTLFHSTPSALTHLRRRALHRSR